MMQITKLLDNNIAVLVRRPENCSIVIFNPSTGDFIKYIQLSPDDYFPFAKGYDEQWRPHIDFFTAGLLQLLPNGNIAVSINYRKVHRDPYTSLMNEEHFFSIMILNPLDGQILREIPQPVMPSSILGLSNNNIVVAYGRIDCPTVVLNPETGMLVTQCETGSRVRNAVLLPDESLVIAGAAMNDAIKIFNPLTGECIREIAQEGTIETIHAMPNGTILCTALDHEYIVYSGVPTESDNPEYNNMRYEAGITTYSKNLPCIKIFNPQTGVLINRLSTSSLSNCNLLTNGDVLVYESSCVHHLIKVIHPITGHMRELVSGNGASIADILELPNNRAIVCDYYNGIFRVIETTTGNTLQEIRWASWSSTIKNESLVRAIKVGQEKKANELILIKEKMANELTLIKERLLNGIKVTYERQAYESGAARLDNVLLSHQDRDAELDQLEDELLKIIQAEQLKPSEQRDIPSLLELHNQLIALKDPVTRTWIREAVTIGEESKFLFERSALDAYRVLVEPNGDMRRHPITYSPYSFFQMRDASDLLATQAQDITRTIQQLIKGNP